MYFHKRFILYFIIGVSLVTRFIGLENLPGVNGDEAWAATKILSYTHGESVGWYTGAGIIRPIDPFFLIILLILHSFFTPSFFILRFSSTLISITTVILSFFLFRRIFSKQTALLITTLIATLPVHLAFSRYAWEPSVVPLAVLISLYFSFRHRFFLTGLFFIWAMIVHPTSIFLAPVLLAPFLEVLLRRNKTNKTSTQRILIVALCGIALTTAFIYLSYTHKGAINYLQIFKNVAGRISDGKQFLGFFSLYSQFISGIHIYRSVIGLTTTSMRIYQYLFLGIIGILFITTMFLALTKKERDKYLLTYGLFISLIIFFLLAGNESITAGLERFTIWMTVPSCVWFVMAFEKLGRWIQRRSFAPIATIGLTSAFLATFQYQYFFILPQKNSTTHPTYLTGEIEPKKAAFEAIDRIRDREKYTVILTPDFWLYWSIKYLSFSRQNYYVQDIDYTVSKGWKATKPEGKYQVFYVDWSNNKLPQTFLRTNNLLVISSIKGYAGQNILNVFSILD